VQMIERDGEGDNGGGVNGCGYVEGGRVDCG
jgi:hypothetical protein